MTDQIIGEWIECVVDQDYEINTAFPYPIRRKGSDRIIGEYQTPNGYVQCSLNRKKYLKHRIIAQQFISNPDNLPQVDHINHNRADNRIENLHWISISENQKNKLSGKGYQFRFVESLPEDARPFEHYGNHEFKDYYISGNQLFLLIREGRYRVLDVRTDSYDKQFYNVMNINGLKTHVQVSRLEN